MKKIFVMFFAAATAISCGKTETKTQDHSLEQHQQSKPKNEMVALMEEMMEEMHSGKPTGNNDADISKMMTEHHDGAVEMSELLLEKGKNDELKNFARKVIEAQNKEVQLMKKFEDRKEASPDSKEFVQELNRSMAAMMDKNIQIHNNIDKDYAQQMIPHHQSAVDMAKVYLKYGKEKELLQLCKDIVKTQNTEIAELKEWLAKN
ncbi:DUF305 domain-containing protein [Chryseobacterium sp. VAUSW3]|uniref:DUF305 domain-containing protein n=1 Tax=Chryseobacterium sp. VAUSW3 TaxID=2010998 RepID=UPI000B4D9417|nr:DUF305 domain-containing protein [Chryseobacterium sp. VAUSW3]OWR14023.1 hypothetical protein CDW55_06715 [Chryseobacterium sp. VAUSW3]